MDPLMTRASRDIREHPSPYVRVVAVHHDVGWSGTRDLDRHVGCGQIGSTRRTHGDMSGRFDERRIGKGCAQPLAREFEAKRRLRDRRLRGTRHGVGCIAGAHSEGGSDHDPRHDPHVLAEVT
jgi:hypothetical protein